MTDGRLILLVTGPAPENEGSAGEAAAGLLWELRHVAGVPVSAVLHPGPSATAVPAPRDAGGTGTRGGASCGGTGVGVRGAAKGGSLGSIVELAVTGLFSAGTVAAIAQVVVAFVRRGAARQITLRDGPRSLSITDPSEETERAVRDWLADPDRGQTGTGSGVG